MTTIPIAGLDLRDAGMAATLAADAAPHRNAGPHIRQTIAHFAATGTTFTADDVREALRGLDSIIAAMNDRPNLLPAMFSHAAKSGLIKAVGYTRATRPARHASVMRVWQGVAA